MINSHCRDLADGKINIYTGVKSGFIHRVIRTLLMLKGYGFRFWWLIPFTAGWMGATAGFADFVAYNDHEPGPDTHLNTTTYGANGVASGFLKDISTGQFTSVTLTTSASGVSYESSTGVPAEGTDAANLFRGYVDFSTGRPHSLALTGDANYTHQFSGLDPRRRYNFAGTAIRGNTGYANRWTLVTLVGADSFRPAHSVGLGIVTSGLASNQVALWTGENHLPDEGFVVRWVDIEPGPDGTFAIVSTQYRGATPGVGTGDASGGSKAYALNGVRLAETSIEGQPTLEINNAADLQATSAVISGQVKNIGADVPFVSICYGTTNAGTIKGNWTYVRELGPQAGPFAATLTGLTPGTTYYCRVWASNSVTTIWAGPTFNFKTLVNPAQIVCLPATNVSAFIAEIGARITDTGGEPPVITLFYGKADGGTATNTWERIIELGSAAYTLTAVLTNLEQRTTYYYRALARNTGGLSWSEPVASFTTGAANPPTIVNTTATDISQFSARVHGSITSTGGDAPVVVLYYGKIDGESVETDWEYQVALGIQSRDFSIDLSGLESDAIYYFRSRAQNQAGTAWAGPSLSFRTLRVLPAQIESLPPVNLSAQSAVLRGKVLDTGGDAPHIWLCYGTVDAGMNLSAWDYALDLGIKTNAIAPYVGNLTASTKYYYRIQGINRAGESWSAEPQSFETPRFTPVTVVINEMHYAPQIKTSPSEFIELFNAGDTAIDLSGWYFSSNVSYRFPSNAVLEAGAYYVVAQDTAEFRRVFGRDPNGVWAPSHRLANEGDTVTLRNVGGEKIDEVAFQSSFPWPSQANRGGASMELLNPAFDNSLGGNWRSSISTPTPGARNSVYRDHDFPVLRQASHTPQQPRSQEDVLVTVKATDLDGMEQVTLEYQVVQPGDYLSLADPRFLTNWQSTRMNDEGITGDAEAGDSIYSVILPGSVQAHRVLVRYRITATDKLGNRVTVPYADDSQPNFAYFVYDGVPSWTASARPGREPEVTYSSNLMATLPIYQLLTTRAAHEDSQRIPQTRSPEYWGSEYLWEGALVYDGTVYDHIHFRARGGVWRYSMGKNMWKFDFNRGHEFQARDDYGHPYQTKWSKLNFSALIQQGNFGQRGEQGLFEAGGFKLHNLADNEASYTHFVHFRIIEHSQETGASTSQFDDDFQGLYLAVEQPDGNFLDEHGLPDGNLYKMEGGNGSRNNQGPTQPTNNSDLSAFMTYASRNKTADWWKQNLNLDSYYSFHAVMLAIHDYDKHAGKNYFYFNNPETGKWSVHTWDLDLTWTTTYDGGGGQGPLNSYLLGFPEFNLGFLNRMREIRDLLFNPEQTGMLLDEIAQFIYTPGQPSFVDADRAMWDYNPIMISSYVNSSKAGQGRYYEAAAQRNFAAMLALEKNYIDTRGQWIDRTILTDSSQVPSTPLIAYRGSAGYPLDDLRFDASGFSSPSGQTLAAVKWRIAHITDPINPQIDPTQPRHYEITATWESSELPSDSRSITIPRDQLKAGVLYRVRARMKDAAGRWSHWSQPIQFTAGNPTSFEVLQTNLVITEVLYNPQESNTSESALGYGSADFEFIELWNRGNLALDLSDVRFTKGIDFNFARGRITRLDPGSYVLVVRNQQAFGLRYGTNLPVAGEYLNEAENKLNNNGDTIKLSYGNGLAIHEFTYLDGTPWPDGAAGGGHSLTLRDPSRYPVDLNLGTNWTASSQIGGTPGKADDPLANWKARFFNPAEAEYAALSANDADPDGDGLPNLWEFAFGTNPRQTNPGRWPIAALYHQGDLNYLTITYPDIIQPETLIFSLESSDDLVHWQTSVGWTLQSRSVDPDNDHVHVLTFRQSVPVSDRPAQFIRMAIQTRSGN
jgi:hypothetical protein